MKNLVVYYSFEGSTKLLGDAIAQKIGADVLAVKPVEEIKSHGFSKYLWGGKSVVMKEEPEIEPLTVDPQNYDVIFIGTPVWAFTYAPALRSFFSKTNIKNKKVAFFCCHEGAKGKTFEHMKVALEGNEILGEMEFIKVFKHRDQSIEQAKAWCEKLI